MSYPLFVSCPRNMEYLLSDELEALGLSVTKVSPMGVYGDASLEILYKICLWSRLANRVQLILFKQTVNDSKELYQRCYQQAWSSIFSAENTIAIEFHGQSDFINNTMFGAQLIKDAIVDYFRDQGDTRPSVDKDNPDIRLHAHIKHNALTVSLDLVGYSLHQRGYRHQAGSAPLKENVAAGILMRAKWPELAEQGFGLCDPFCGSGTFLIEAALMATDTAPGLLRDDQALPHWKQHDAALWASIRGSATAKRKACSNKFIGFDIEPKMIPIAIDNCEAAGLQDVIVVKQQALKDFQHDLGPSLLICNPPYGERLSDVDKLIPLYKELGKMLHQHCQGWFAAVLTSEQRLAQTIGLRMDKHYTFYNGQIEAKLYCFTLNETNQFKESTEIKLSPGAQSLFNRLTKDKKHLSKWVKRKAVSCYRLYDAELPEYAFAVDVYNDWAHVQEYAPPKTIPEKKAEKRVQEMLQVLPRVLDISPKQVVLKQRKQQKGKQQYQAMDHKRQKMVVTEGPAKLLVNLRDYLDTGLFLDHRLLRLQFSAEKQGKKLLNCFCYTASVSVHAALAGMQTTNVDLSNTYLDWARQNFSLNKLPLTQHQFIQADCLQWLRDCKDTFDVIFLDPPSFSNSKRMEETLDIQRDHEALIDDAIKLLAPGGTLYFSNNFKKFKLANTVREKYQVKDITRQTIDEDFKHSSKIHQCYLIQQLR